MRTTLAALLLAVPLTSTAQAPPAATPPLRIVGSANPVTFREGGAMQTYYRLAPGKPIELATSGPMVLVVPARAIGEITGSVQRTITIVVIVPGTAPVTYREVLPGSTAPGATVDLSDQSLALPSKLMRVPIAAASSTVRITVDAAPGAIVGFARAPLAGISAAPTPKPVVTPAVAVATPVATPGAGKTPVPTATPIAVAAATPPPSGLDAAMGGGEDPLAGMAMMPLPLIRRKVERLGLGPRVAYVFPTGAVDGGSEENSNIYAGAELRFTPSFFERALSFTAEGGVYTLRDVEPLNATSPFGIATEGEVRVSTRVVPLLGGTTWRMKISGDKRAVFVGANGGVVLATRTEEVEFRGPTTTSETRFGGQGRVGFEQKLGPGRTVVEASYLHVTPGEDELNDTYLGGALLGLQYRFVF